MTAYRPCLTLLGATCLLVLGGVCPGAEAGWRRLQTENGGYALCFIPTSIDQSQMVPVTIFFHGSGATPELYKAAIAGPAETAKLVVILPCALKAGTWETKSDGATAVQSLAQVQKLLHLDMTRLSLSGHSVGAIFAYATGLTSTLPLCGIFTLGAPFYQLPQQLPQATHPHIHMYYGKDDPLLTNGSEAAVAKQFQQLHVDSDLEVIDHFAHGDLPAEALLHGFQFLAGTAPEAVSAKPPVK